MRQRLASLLALVSVFASAAACSSRPAETPPGRAPADRPNVLLILLDDLGWDDLGIHGNRLVETPHIDALARESVRFESFYVTPVCRAWSWRTSRTPGRPPEPGYDRSSCAVAEASAGARLTTGVAGRRVQLNSSQQKVSGESRGGFPPGLRVYQ